MPADNVPSDVSAGPGAERSPPEIPLAHAAALVDILGRVAMLEKQLRATTKHPLAGWQHIIALVSSVLTCIFIFVAALSAYTAYNNWQDQVIRQRDLTTLSYLDALGRADFNKALFYLQEFTICFENDIGRLGAGGAHLSYLTTAEVEKMPNKNDIAKKWWRQIEHDDFTEDFDAKLKGYCGKRKGIEEDLILVYGRIEALASCIATSLCDIDRIIRDVEGKWSCAPSQRPRNQLIEVFDHLTILAVSNYLLLAHDTSREWDVTSANFEVLIKRIEKWTLCQIEKTRDEIWKGRNNGPLPTYPKETAPAVPREP